MRKFKICKKEPEAAIFNFKEIINYKGKNVNLPLSIAANKQDLIDKNANINIIENNFLSLSSYTFAIH